MKTYLFNYSLVIPGIFLLTVVFHLFTYAGLDTDFQAHALYAKQIHAGLTPYQDFWSNKPPLYSVLLLPGNWLGGHLISFFMVPLFIVGIVGGAIYWYSSKISSPAQSHIGLWSWALFLLLTAGQFLRAGNLNAGIIFPVLAFSLMAFHQIMLIGRELSEGRGISNKRFFLIGLFAGVAFAFRFHGSSVMIFTIFMVYNLIIRNISWRTFLNAAVIFTTGFIIPSLLTLIYIGFPFQPMYEDLIVFNRVYSNTSSSSSVLVSLIKNFALFILRFLKYAHILLPFALIPFIIFLIEWKRYISRRRIAILAAIMTAMLPMLLYGQSNDPTILGMYSTRKFAVILLYLMTWFAVLGSVFFYRPLTSFLPLITDRIASLKFPQMNWLFIYLLAEIFMMTLQGKTRSNVYFPVFVPLVILASYFIDSFIMQYSKNHQTNTISATYRKRVSIGIIGLLIGGYLLSYSIHSKHISRVDPFQQLSSLVSHLIKGDPAVLGEDNTWPEQQLIEAILKHAPGSTDLFTLDFMAYLYLETNKLPPISYNHYDKRFWTTFNTLPERESEIWRELKRINPRVITTRKDFVQDGAREFLSHYKKIGTYPTNHYNYREVDFYIREDK